MYGTRHARGFSLRLGMAAAALAGSCAPLPPNVALLDPDLQKHQESSEPAAAESGLVYMFPGLLGYPGELDAARRALRDAGIQADVRVFAWSTPPGDIAGHMNQDTNRALAADVVAALQAYRVKQPNAPIDLIGYSAGGYLALRVAEASPPEVGIRNVILAQPDVSPAYDLTRAMSHIDGKIVNFYAPSDWFLSLVFTSILGTMDGVFGATAGKEGFDVERAVPEAAHRRRIEQVRWSREWADAGHPGNHMAILQYRWNRYIVAPYVVDAPNLRDTAGDDAGSDPAADSHMAR